ncbi:MAG: hypothetical protein GF331_06430, partial [Chitinivibrionales bacterium]|nr:hypothetical protein [Chitinivibrionales bacterium]
MARGRSQTASRTQPGVIVETGKCESGINLGGIGTGGVEIWPDGRLYQWNLVNSRPWAGYERGDAAAPIQPAVMDADWFVRIAEKGKRPVYRWLFTGHGHALGTASHFWRVHKYFFIKSFPEIRYDARYPLAELDYVDPSLPVEIRLRAWTSMIPRDVKNSSLPGCFFDFSFVNKSAKQLEVSLVWQQQNLAGYAAGKLVQKHEKKVLGKLHAVDMRGSTAEPGHDTSGSMCMWAIRNPGQRITMVACNPYMQNLIWPIHLKGALDGPIMPPHISHEELNPEPSTRAPNKGWLCVRQTLAPRKRAEMHLGLSWFFPRYHSVKGTPLKHVYANWFDSAVEVAQYQAKHRAKLLERASLLPSLLMRSTLPDALKLSLLDQLSTLTKSTQFISDGRVGLQEGHGCCAFNTVDVDHYSSYALSTLWPELRRKILEMQTALAHPKTGKIHHGLPGTVEEIEITPKTREGYNRWDVCCQYVLQLYRDTKWAGDTDTMKAFYPTAKRAMELLAGMDFYGVGLPFIQGGITYDHWNMVGVVGYMAGVYIAGLRALEDMALVVGDDDGAAWARLMAERGTRGFEKFLWNGKQYLLFYGRRHKGWKPEDDVRGEHKLFDPVKPPAEFMPEDPEHCGPDCACHREKNYVEVEDTGLMTDLLNGNGTAAVMGLGAFLDPARVRKQLRMIYNRNVQDDNLCLVNGTYPDGHYLDQWPFMQWQTPWTGTEYFFALMCYAAGMVKEGDRVIDLVYERHVREGMRFDHAECNNHYARPLSIWGAYAARLGLDVDGYRKRLTIKPADGKAYDGAFITAQGMGMMQYVPGKSGVKLELRLEEGSLPVKALTLGTAGAPRKAVVTLDGKRVSGEVETEHGEATLTFDRMVRLKA